MHDYTQMIMGKICFKLHHESFSNEVNQQGLQNYPSSPGNFSVKVTGIAGADPREGLCGLETPLQTMSYSKVSDSNNYFTGAK